jgi:SAM-dependent methyltransferase
MRKRSRTLLGRELPPLLGDRIPNDDSRQRTAPMLVEELAATGVLPTAGVVLDLGCGAGDSVDLFRCVLPNCDWLGVDIEDSNEVRDRRRRDAQFLTFDGMNIPVESNSVDIVYSRQVLEHVRYPAELIRDAGRVLRPGGVFVGSTSQIEAYHSRSFWGYTPHGLTSLLEEDGGLQVRTLRPGMDGPTILLRQAMGTPQRLFRRARDVASPLNRLFDVAGYVRGAEHQAINATKLLYCGHICWVAVKPV